MVLELESLSRMEKWQILEKIWEDLRQDFDEKETPAWHREILEKREKELLSGHEELLDWETCKKELLDR